MVAISKLNNVDYKIKLRQGLQADLEAYSTNQLFQEGEPAWTTDTHNFYVGDEDGEAILVAAAANVVALVDATPAIDASAGSLFTLVATGDRTINAPTNPTNGQRIIIRHKASGANRTLALTATAGAGNFRFGTDITVLTATTLGLTDYVGAIYNLTDDRWDVVSYVKGF